MRKIATLLIVSLAPLGVSRLARAQSEAPSINRNFPWEGEITGTNVYIRSGAGSNYYPTTKVGPGTRVLVVGEKFVGSSRVDLQACKLEYSIVSPK